MPSSSIYAAVGIRGCGHLDRDVLSLYSRFSTAAECMLTGSSVASFVAVLLASMALTRLTTLTKLADGTLPLIPGSLMGIHAVLGIHAPSPVGQFYHTATAISIVLRLDPPKPSRPACSRTPSSRPECQAMRRCSTAYPVGSSFGITLRARSMKGLSRLRTGER